MHVLCLISGGKDSLLAMTEAAALGHTVVALANLAPPWEAGANQDEEEEEEGRSDVELDSFMFQSAGSAAVPMQAAALRLPLYRRRLRPHSSHITSMQYDPSSARCAAADAADGRPDEVEEMFSLIRYAVRDAASRLGVKIDCVCSGAVYSDYQRLRVENVCQRLGLVSLAPLWRRSEEALLRDVAHAGISAMIVKVACIGLKPSRHLGAMLTDLAPELGLLKAKYGASLVGEGGEFESLVVDHPAFTHKLVIEDGQIVHLSNDSIAPPGVLHFSRVVMEEEKNSESARDWSPLRNAMVVPRDQDLPAAIWLDTEDDSIDALASADVDSGAMAIDNPGSLWSTSLIKNGDFISVGCRLRGVGASASSPFPNSGTETAAALSHVRETLASEGVDMDSILYVHLYLADMGSFAEVNSHYSSIMRRCARAPSRCCVEVKFPPLSPATIAVDVLACHHRRGDYRRTLHVASISHWAPSCIGPYAQANSMQNFIFVAGQLGLEPISMEVMSSPSEDGDVEEGPPRRVNVETSAALRSCGAIMGVMGSAMGGDVMAMTVYINVKKMAEASDVDHIVSLVESSVRNNFFEAPLLYVVVSDLPKGVLVELQPLARSSRSFVRERDVEGDDDVGHGADEVPLASLLSKRGSFEFVGGETVSIHTVASSGFFARTLIEFPQLDHEFVWNERDEVASTEALRLTHALDDALRLAGLQRQHIMAVRVYYKSNDGGSEAMVESLLRGIGGSIGGGPHGRDIAVCVPVIDLGMRMSDVTAVVMQIDAMQIL